MNTKQFLNNSILVLKNNRRYDTSVLIPEKYIEIVRKNSNFYGGLQKFIQNLIKNHIQDVEVISKYRFHVLTKYQEKNLNLVKWNFRPESRDWQVMKQVSNHLGYSICLLFVILLEINLKILKKNSSRKITLKLGVPAKSLNLYSFSQLKLKKEDQYLLYSRFKIG